MINQVRISQKPKVVDQGSDGGAGTALGILGAIVGAAAIIATAGAAAPAVAGAAGAAGAGGTAAGLGTAIGASQAGLAGFGTAGALSGGTALGTALPTLGASTALGIAPVAAGTGAAAGGASLGAIMGGAGTGQALGGAIGSVADPRRATQVEAPKNSALSPVQSDEGNAMKARSDQRVSILQQYQDLSKSIQALPSAPPEIQKLAGPNLIKAFAATRKQMNGGMA